MPQIAYEVWTDCVQAFLASLERIDGCPHLIVVPLSLVDVWVREIQNRTSPVPNFCIYLRSSHTIEQLMTYDIVIVTYERVSYEDAEFEKTEEMFQARRACATYHQQPTRCNNTLSAIQWNVVVTDEAHAIVNDKTRKFKGLHRLDSKYRLPLTGTPFSNEYDDLRTFMEYLNISPWGDKALFEEVQCYQDRDKFTRVKADCSSTFCLRHPMRAPTSFCRRT